MPGLELPDPKMSSVVSGVVGAFGFAGRILLKREWGEGVTERVAERCGNGNYPLSLL